jgi:hypothetical protein
LQGSSLRAGEIGEIGLARRRSGASASRSSQRASTASGTRDPGAERTHTHMYTLDLRGAHIPSQTGAYKLVCTTLSFRGETKSHPEQQARGALMGRPIKKDSDIVNGATYNL